MKKNIKIVNVEDDSLDINKLSVKERQELQDQGLCFWCRKLGNISRDYPSKPKKPGEPVSRKVQQVTGRIWRTRLRKSQTKKAKMKRTIFL